MAAPHSAIQTAAAVRETSTTTGAGTFNLDGSVTGFQTFVAGIGNGNLCPYYIRIRNGSEWEWGIGTVSDGSPDTLERTTVLRSSNSDAAVNFSAGTKDVFCASHPAAIPHVTTSAPTNTDDNDGSRGTFLPGSIWVDTTNDIGYICVDDTDGAAQWHRITAQPDNLLLNGDFSQWYRQSTGSTATADDDYFAPKWYSLIQGTGSTVLQETSLLSSTRDTQTGCRLTAGGTTNRFGIAQIVEARQSQQLQGRDAIFQVALRSQMNAGSGDMDVRIALLEWTGAQDAVTSDVVNDWTSGTYTTGNFFNSTTLTLIGTAQAAVADNVWQVLSVSGSVSNGCDNLIVMIWTEDVPDHAADYLQITEAGLYEARAVQPWRARHNERQLCERFCQRLEPSSVGTFIDASRGNLVTQITGRVEFPTMRAVPTFSHTITSWANTGAMSQGDMDFYNYVTNSQATISGSLTLSLSGESRSSAGLLALAATSFSGSNGDQGRLRFGSGTDDYLILDAEL